MTSRNTTKLASRRRPDVFVPGRQERDVMKPVGQHREHQVVITGIGLIASVGRTREAVWDAVRNGRSGVRFTAGLKGIPPFLPIAAPVDIGLPVPRPLKVIELCRRAAAEAVADAALDLSAVDLTRFGCAISGHMGDTDFVAERCRTSVDGGERVPWWQQWLPNTACATVAQELGLAGPRICHSTACASGTIDILAAARAIRDGQCDIALAGSGEAIHPLFAAGFLKMRVLASHDDPPQACRPFDRLRRGFVMGEGAAMLVLESLDHALLRGAPIYAEIVAGKMMAEGHHVTDLNEESDTLAQLITTTLKRGNVSPQDVGYVNAHGTGTVQNDIVEVRGIRKAFGRAADSVCVSAIKSMLGHLVNASGSVELAITTLALRDGYLPPTVNLTDQDPDCDLDCIALVGRRRAAEYAIKLSVAFGGHLAAVLLRRWPAARSQAACADQRMIA